MVPACAYTFLYMNPLMITAVVFQFLAVLILFTTRRRARVNNFRMRRALKIWVRAHQSPVALQEYGR